MTAPADRPFAPEELSAALIERGLLGRGQKLNLVEYPSGFLRLHDARRWHFRVSDAKADLCHLIVGLNLARIHDRAARFAQACPALVCRPLHFWERKDGLGFLCLEHFAGDSLDHAVEQGRCTSSQWLDRTRQAQALLAKTGQESSAEALTREVQALVDEACSYPGLSPFDAQLLRGPAQQAILAGALSEPIIRQWTNGDFAGRNLLIGDNGDVRLIDYEYAEPTHFKGGDWLRLFQFSTLPAGLDPKLVPELEAARQPWQEVHFWVHHLTQLKHAGSDPAVNQHVAEAVAGLFRAIGRAAPAAKAESPASLLINLASAELTRLDALAVERTAWARALESEVKAREDVVKERSDWGKALDLELTKARESLDKLTAEYAERTSWARSIEAELAQTRETYRQLHDEFTERTKWALSLRDNLEKTQAESREWERKATEVTRERDQLTALLEDRSKLIERLGSELQAIRHACAALATLLPFEPAKGEILLLEKCLVTVATLRQEIAERAAATGKVAAAELNATLRAETAESEIRRLTVALQEAQVHLDGLLMHAAERQRLLNTSEAARDAAEASGRGREKELTSALAQLERARENLARFEQSWICRLVAGSAPKPNPPIST